MKQLVFFHWDVAEAKVQAKEIEALGWKVEIEAEDGARGCKRVLAAHPDAIVISLDRLPSHGRRTAAYLRTTKAGEDLPIVFIGGSGEPLEKARAQVPDAVFTTREGVAEALSHIPEPSGGGGRDR
jgi:CheY-like chemotaxis protein